MPKTRIGKITSARFGYGGYDDAMFGISFSLGSEKDCWCVGDFRGWWISRTSGADWTEADRIRLYGEAVDWVVQLVKDAKRRSFDELVGVPVEVTFENNGFGKLEKWRVLTEVV